MKKLYQLISFLLLFSFVIPLNAQLNLDTVKFQKHDNGKQWAFDYPPVDYLKKTYNLKTNEEWFEDIRLSALRLPGCTSSFVSEDGLMMTNHHCARGLLERLKKEGEDLIKDGFFAKTLAEERKIPNYYADQLVLIKDVTEDIHNAEKEGTTVKEKAEKKKAKIKELSDKYQKETGLQIQIIPLFNGGKYSLYGYKRYTDIRLVFAPEMQVAYFGGDYDNFTYPRYNLDCTFYRAYENDKPVKSTNYFKFSLNGIEPGEPIFTVGNPGTTNRLKTVAQLEFARDITYRNNAFLFDSYYYALEDLKKEDPSRAKEFEDLRVQLGNSQKVISTTLKGLKDPYVYAKKVDFQKKLQEAVNKNSSLKEKYGKVWENIESTRNEARKIAPQMASFSFVQNRMFGSRYFGMAKSLLDVAKELQKPEDQRAAQYKAEKLDSTLKALFPEKIDELLENTKLWINIEYMALNLGWNDPLVKKLSGGKKGKEIAKWLLDNSIFGDRDDVIDLAKEGAEAIMKSEDPILFYVKEVDKRMPELQKQMQEVTDTEGIYDDMLGQAIVEVYGTELPPDANFTLRLSDGTLKAFEYNGTVAPYFTTFYGMYDRWHSFYKKYPWDLHKIWEKVPADFDLATPFNFVSNNDIVGGNSGSAVINKNAEVVGLAFDGNIDSIIGNYIYIPYNNRMVAVDSRAMVYAIEKVYKATRVSNELKNGKMD
ncbi:MAG: S46 family peptidase [Melioribacteraceae bacterium]|nr:S46 family peptidase [Melioribacteraceae bacterium]